MSRFRDALGRFAHSPVARQVAGSLGGGLTLAAAIPLGLTQLGSAIELLVAGAIAGTVANVLRKHWQSLPAWGLAATLPLLLTLGSINDACLSVFGASMLADAGRLAVLGALLTPPAAFVLRAAADPLVTAVGVAIGGAWLAAWTPIPLLILAAIGGSLVSGSTRVSPWTQRPWQFAIGLSGGLLAVAAWRLLLLWSPPSWLCVLSLAIALPLAGRLRGLVSSIVVLAVAATLLTIEPLALRAALSSTATIDSPLLLTLLRVGSGVLLLTVPLATMLGDRSHLGVAAASSMFALAMLIPATPAMLVIASGSVAVLPLVATTDWSVRRRCWKPVAAATLFAAAVVTGGISQTTPAALLFSGDAFAATRQGRTLTELLASVEPRPVTTRQSPAGPVTVWNVDGLRTTVRTAGLPSGTMTVDPRLAASDGSAAVAVAASLAIHPQPDRVALVGIGAGETLLSSVQYPVRSLVVVDTADRVALAHSLAGSRESLLDDDRVTTIDCDERHLRAIGPLGADVVIVGHSQPALLDACGRFSPRRLQTLAGHLAHDGLLVHRLATPDLMPQSLAAIARTLDQFFADVAILEAGPGEVLLLAGSLDDRLDADAYAKRLKRPHSRAVLADAGLDWASLLEARLLDPETTRELVAEYPPLGSFDATAERRFILDLMDWRPKWKGHLATWEGFGTAWAERLDDVGFRRNALARIDDIRERTQIIANHPDEYWAYRKTLRKRLQERPRSEVRQVGGELIHGLHPEDERRKQYLTALGEATRDRTAEQIDRLDRFERPFDPLVSVFLHGEAARLNEVAQRSGPALSHRTAQMMAVPGDVSVRPVLGAIEQLLAQPDLIADDQTRYDFAHGLLSQLQRRWLQRSARGVRSQLEGLDLDESVRLTRRLLTACDRFAEQAGTQSHWRRRRSVIKRDLLDGLRSLQDTRSAESRQIARLQARMQAEQEATDRDAIDGDLPQKVREVLADEREAERSDR